MINQENPVLKLHDVMIQISKEPDANPIHDVLAKIFKLEKPSVIEVLQTWTQVNALWEEAKSLLAELPEEFRKEVDSCYKRLANIFNLASFGSQVKILKQHIYESDLKALRMCGLMVGENYPRTKYKKADLKEIGKALNDLAEKLLHDSPNLDKGLRDTLLLHVTAAQRAIHLHKWFGDQYLRDEFKKALGTAFVDNEEMRAACESEAVIDFWTAFGRIADVLDVGSVFLQIMGPHFPTLAAHIPALAEHIVK